MPGVVACAAAHRALALFIVPVLPAAGPYIIPRTKTKAKAKAPEPWFDYLLRHSLLSFKIPRAAFRGPGGSNFAPHHGMMAVLAQFGANGQVKSMKSKPLDAAAAPCTKPPKPKLFSLSCIPGWPRGSRCLRPAPEMFPRASPEGYTYQPSSSFDTHTTSSPSVPKLPAPKSPQSAWPISRISQGTIEYPCPVLRDLALQVMSGQLQPFVGALDASVTLPDRVRSEPESLALREIMCKGVARGNMAVFPSIPFKFCRLLPFGAAPKHKYDPASPEIRLTSDASADDHGGSSINDLSSNPMILRPHFVASFLRDTFAAFGPGCLVSIRDVKKAFRLNKTHPSLLHLFVYKMMTAEFGTEFFVDLANCFGWRPSEWGWQCCLGLIEWLVFKSGVDSQFAWVDNFFQFHIERDKAAATASSLRVKKFMSSLGLELHEDQDAVSAFKGLGWEWDSDSPHSLGPMTMSCPEDKYTHFCVLFASWSESPSICVHDLERMVGIMVWLSAGFPGFSAYTGPIINELTKGKRLCRRMHKPPKLFSVPVVPLLAEAVSFAACVLSTWDRVCPVVQGFGPSAHAHIRGWVDSCTGKRIVPPGEWRGGTGGVFFDPASKTLLGFFHEWSPREKESLLCATAQSSPACELLGFAYWMDTFAHRCARLRLLLAVDADAAMQALEKAFSARADLLQYLRFVRLAAAKNFTCMRVRSVVGASFMEVADCLSRGLVDRATKQAWSLFGIRLVVKRIVRPLFAGPASEGLAKR